MLSHCLRVPLSHDAIILSLSSVPLSHCLTVPLSHCLTVSLSYFYTVLVSHCLTVSLSYFYTVLVSHYLTVPLSHCRGGSRGGGLLGLQPPQTILSSPSHLYTRLTIAWHSSCHSMVSGLKPTGGARWLVVHPEHGFSYE